MADIDPRRAFIVTYRKLFRHWQRCNLSEEVSTDLAIKGAKERHPLTEDQQRDVDGFLKVKASAPKEKSKPSVPINTDFDVMERHDSRSLQPRQIVFMLA
jgi:hypothetical protein